MARHQKRRITALFKAFDNDAIWQNSLWNLLSFYFYSAILRHVGNIFKDKEVDQKRDMQKMHIPNSDKPVSFYSLDVVLAVGYRTNSKVAIGFRKWATKTLRSHIVDGYTINPKRI